MVTDSIPTEQSDPIVGKIESFIRRYVVIPPAELRVIAVWVLHTWQFSEQCPTPNVTPYLYIHSAQKGSGKTLLGIDILDVLTRNPILATSITPAALFRLIEQLKPTMLVDEVDTIYNGSKNEELRGVLNAGYRRGAKIPRVQGQEVIMFSPFAPKALIGIDNAMMPDTIRDRCIPIKMRRANAEERQTVEPFYHYEIEDEVAALQTELHVWSLQHGRAVQGNRPKVSPTLSPRQWEITMSLLQVAHAAGCERTTREAVESLFGEVIERRSVEQDMLDMIRELYETEDTDRLSSREILTHLATDPRFSGMSGKGLAVKLDAFDVKGGVIRRGNQVDRGYLKSSFADAWERYL